MVDPRRLRSGGRGKRGKDCGSGAIVRANVGDKLVIAFGVKAPGREGRVDTVALVGPGRGRSSRSGLERLTFAEARALDDHGQYGPSAQDAQLDVPRPPDPIADAADLIDELAQGLRNGILDTLIGDSWPARPPAPLPPGASPLELATQPPAPPTRRTQLAFCDLAGYEARLVVEDGALVTDGPDVVWPRGFSARLVAGRGELVAPDGTVVGREGGIIMAGGGYHGEWFSACGVDGKFYGPAS
ncbi:MAG: hypothetical protein ACC726_15825 [Chloroflexota bacterium]